MDRYEAGATCRQVAVECQLAKTSVLKILKTAGAVMRDVGRHY